MKIVRFYREGTTAYGVLEGEIVRAIHGSVFRDFRVGNVLCQLNEVKLLAPAEPRVVVGIGANYLEHIEEAGYEVPSDPVVFLKPASSVIGHGQNIVYPQVSREVNFAGELAVVIKYQAKHVEERDALRYVLGYTCANDITASDLRSSLTQTLAKGMYTFCPLGPWIETNLDAGNTKLRSWLNGVLKQEANTREMIFSISRIISYVSGFMALEPGGVIITGSSRRGSTTILKGDKIEVEIEGIGRLENKVASEEHEHGQ